MSEKRWNINKSHYPFGRLNILVQVNFTFNNSVDFLPDDSKDTCYRGVNGSSTCDPVCLFICHPATGTIEERMQARERKQWEHTIAEVEFYSKHPLNL